MARMLGRSLRRPSCCPRDDDWLNDSTGARRLQRHREQQAIATEAWRETRRFKRAEARQVATWIAELPDPSILDAYDEIVCDGKRRMLAMRSQSASWEEVGGVLDAAMRQAGRELRYEVPGWPE